MRLYTFRFQNAYPQNSHIFTRPRNIHITPFHTKNNFKSNNLHKKPSHTNNMHKKPLHTNNMYKKPSHTNNLYKKPSHTDNSHENHRILTILIKTVAY